MAAFTTSAPQQGVDLPAVDLRTLVGGLVSTEGVSVSTDLLVAQRAAGANMSVDVAAGQGVVKDDHTGGAGFYSALFKTISNVVIGTAHASLPRIDRIVLRIRDAYYQGVDGDAANDATIVCVPGTATAGATLANLNGAAAVPGSSLLLANVLVDAAVASIVTAKIDSGTTVRPQVAMNGVSTGTQLGYTEFTADVTINQATEGAAVVVVTGATISFDGVTACMVQFWCPYVETSATSGDFVEFVLYDSFNGAAAASIGLWGVTQAVAAVKTQVPFNLLRRLTPASGTHAYSARAFVTNAARTGTAKAGVGGSGALMPGFIRVTKAA